MTIQQHSVGLDHEPIRRTADLGLKIAKRQLNEVEYSLDHLRGWIAEGFDSESLYEFDGYRIHLTRWLIVKRSPASLLVECERQPDMRMRIKLCKFKDGQAFHRRYSFLDSMTARQRVEAAAARHERWQANYQANVEKWQQRVAAGPVDATYTD